MMTSTTGPAIGQTLNVCAMSAGERGRTDMAKTEVDYLRERDDKAQARIVELEGQLAELRKVMRAVADDVEKDVHSFRIGAVMYGVSDDESTQMEVEGLDLADRVSASCESLRDALKRTEGGE
jgi:hypothetical protein